MEIPREYELLVLNGDLPAPSETRRLCGSAQRIIASDGGANLLQPLGISPHFVLGDLDSIFPETQQQLGPEKIHKDEDQNFSDFEKTMKVLRESPCRRLGILGMSGGRYDHQIINLSVASRFARNMEIWIQDRSGVGELISAVDGPATRSYSCRPQQLTSLIGLPEAKEVSTRGLHWELSGQALQFGAFDSLSNFCTGKELSISLQSGQVLVYFPRHTDLRGGASRKRSA